MSNNRREFFRVTFNEYYKGEILVGLQTIPIQIDNMGVGGLGFTSTIELSHGSRLQCRFTILDQEFVLQSKVVRKNRQQTEIEYGLEFDIDQKTATQLFKYLNKYVMEKRKGRL